MIYVRVEVARSIKIVMEGKVDYTSQKTGDTVGIRIVLLCVTILQIFECMGFSKNDSAL